MIKTHQVIVEGNVFSLVRRYLHHLHTYLQMKTLNSSSTAWSPLLPLPRNKMKGLKMENET
jgi:hypothetical protein